VLCEEVLKLVEDDLLGDQGPQVLRVVEPPPARSKPDLTAHLRPRLLNQH